MGCWNNCLAFSSLLQHPGRAKTQPVEPKATTSWSQCHLFWTVTGVTLVVLAKPALRLVGMGTWLPPACHRHWVLCCAAAVGILPWRGHSYRSGTAREWCLNFPSLPSPCETPNSCHRQLYLWEPTPHLHWYQTNPISAPSRHKQAPAQSQETLALETDPQLPVHSACSLHPECPAQRQRLLVRAACEPFFLHKSTAESRVESNSSQKSIHYFRSAWKSTLICHKFRMLSMEAGADQKPHVWPRGFAVCDANWSQPQYIQHWNA